MFKVWISKNNDSNIVEGEYTVYNVLTEPNQLCNNSIVFLVYAGKFKLVRAIWCTPINE